MEAAGAESSNPDLLSGADACIARGEEQPKDTVSDRAAAGESSGTSQCAGCGEEKAGLTCSFPSKSDPPARMPPSATLRCIGARGGRCCGGRLLSGELAGRVGTPAAPASVRVHRGTRLFKTAAQYAAPCEAYMAAESDAVRQAEAAVPVLIAPLRFPSRCRAAQVVSFRLNARIISIRSSSHRQASPRVHAGAPRLPARPARLHSAQGVKARSDVRLEAPTEQTYQGMRCSFVAANPPAFQISEPWFHVSYHGEHEAAGFG